MATAAMGGSSGRDLRRSQNYAEDRD